MPLKLFLARQNQTTDHQGQGRTQSQRRCQCWWELHQSLTLSPPFHGSKISRARFSSSTKVLLTPILRMEEDDEYRRTERTALVVIVVLASLAVVALLVAFSYYCYIRNKVSKQLKHRKSKPRYYISISIHIRKLYWWKWEREMEKESFGFVCSFSLFIFR